MGIHRALIAFAILMVVSLYPCSGAVVHGVVYNWEDLKPLPKAVIVVNTTPEQKYVTPDGHYSFNLPPGHYVIRAYYYRNGRVVLYAEDNVTIKSSNGSYIVDLILFPPLNFNFSQPNIEFPAPAAQSSGSNNLYAYVAAGILAVAAVAVAFYLIRKRRGDERAERVGVSNAGKTGSNAGGMDAKSAGVMSASAGESEGMEVQESQEEARNVLAALPDDLRETLEIIVEAGGRITQKELRTKLRYSEAKVSLILTDLERRGYIEKVRKGRGNVVFLRDEYRKFFGLE